MERYALILFWILVLAVILLSTPTKCTLGGGEDGVEGFYTYYGYYKNYCPSCGHLSRYGCSKCNNCGICVTPSGQSQCVSGDSRGPFFRSDCQAYFFNDPYIYYPYSHLYPVVKRRSIYPYYRYKVNRPWKWNRQHPYRKSK